jgi:hypothetical protein
MPPWRSMDRRACACSYGTSLLPSLPPSLPPSSSHMPPIPPSLPPSLLQDHHPLHPLSDRAQVPRPRDMRHPFLPQKVRQEGGSEGERGGRGSLCFISLSNQISRLI